MSIENDIRQIAVAHQAADGALLPMLVAVNRALGYVPAEADAVWAGLGALIGLLAGALGKLAASIAMIAVFTISVFANTLGREEPIPETLPALIESVGAESPTNAAPGTIPAAAATRK